MVFGDNGVVGLDVLTPLTVWCLTNKRKDLQEFAIILVGGKLVLDLEQKLEAALHAVVSV